MKRLIAFAALALATLGYAAPAHACFDGFSVASERVGATMRTDGSWRLAEARTMARWTARLEALLPAGATMTMESVWSVGVCSAQGECQDVAAMDGSDDPILGAGLEQQMARVFERTASTLGVSARQRALARGTKATLYVVQIGAFRSWGAASDLAAKINMNAQHGSPGWEHHTFYSAGGYPALHNPVAVHGTEVGAETMHRVIAGVFVDADEARAQRARLAQAGFASALSVEHL